MKTSQAEIKSVTVDGRDIRVDKSNYSYLNVGPGERAVSAVTGTVLTVYGALFTENRKSGATTRWYQALALPVGLYLLKRGISGYCALSARIGRDTAQDSDRFEIVEVSGRAEFTVKKDKLYQTWRNLENLPHFFPHLERVTVLDDNRSRWTLRLPTGLAKLEWTAELVDDIPNKLITWRSVEGSDIGNEGEVRFSTTQGGQSSAIEVRIKYIPPAGRVGKNIAKLFSGTFKRTLEKELTSFGSREIPVISTGGEMSAPSI